MSILQTQVPEIPVMLLVCINSFIYKSKGERYYFLDFSSLITLQYYFLLMGSLMT